MARPYASELADIPDTFDWAISTKIDTLRKAVCTAGLSPLRAIGSGGSLTGAHALAYFHQYYTGHIAVAATPLEAMDEPLDGSMSNWLLSAGGRNVDILKAARTLIEREPRQLAILCGQTNSPLARLCREHPFTDLLLFPPPSRKDGFLATNSLLGFTILLARAYAEEFSMGDQWNKAVEVVGRVIREVSGTVATWEHETSCLWERGTILLLYGPSARLGAIDLESKFTEAALGNLQLADYRNFAHGRHHWLAKRGEVSSVLAFITDADKVLAEKTLRLIPTNIPQARLVFPGNAIATTLLSIVAALWTSGWAGTARSIDPGRPGVPDFGRKLYRLRIPFKRTAIWRDTTTRDAVAISRKAGVPLQWLAKLEELDYWQTALNSFRTRLLDAQFAGVIFDYDGTIVDVRERTCPPSRKMTAELVRLLEIGAWIAVATGRGASVRRDLQSCLPSCFWDRVLVGYYNGAEIAQLNENDAPDGSNVPNGSLSDVAALLHAYPEIDRFAKQTNRRFQITLEAAHALPENRLWDLAQHAILSTAAKDCRVFRSGHSVDIVATSVSSKIKVVKQLHKRLGNKPILVIGDQGKWPGNDYELLSSPFSLSVDAVSIDPKTCWNLAQLGQRGPVVTLSYLEALKYDMGRIQFKESELR